MTAALRVGGATRNITGISVRVGGAPKTVTEGWIRKSGTLKQFFSTLRISLSTYSRSGRGNSAGTVTVTSGQVTAVPEGAIGDVSYLWTRTSPDGHAWTINNSTGATTSFSTQAAPNTDWFATFICTVTDEAGQALASDEVEVDCANIYFGGHSGVGGPFP